MFNKFKNLDPLFHSSLTLLNAGTIYFFSLLFMKYFLFVLFRSENDANPKKLKIDHHNLYANQIHKMALGKLNNPSTVRKFSVSEQKETINVIKPR
mgnify:CR=1 FL=1